MNIADELAAYITPNGYPCRLYTLATSHPAEHADLLEAIASNRSYSVVARWWNDTRCPATGLHLSDGTVSRHRNKLCPRCL